MPSNGSNTPQNVVTTQNRDPWVGAQPHLTEVLENARGLFESQSGYQPWRGETQAALDPYERMAYSATGQIAGQGLPTIDAARNLGYQMQANQGLNAGNQAALSGLNQAGANYAGIYNDIAPQRDATLAGLNQAGINYASIYNDASGQQNPYLLAQIAANDRRISDRVNSTMSGSGRYGSGAHTDVLARSLAEAANPILAQDYAQRQANRLAATQGYGATQQAMGNAYNQAQAQQMAATQGFGGIQGAMNDIYSGGLNRAGQFAQLAPALDQARYSDIDRLAAMGGFGRGYEQAALTSGIQQYNTQQAYPWEQLARYNAIAGGAGGLGGSQVTSAPNVNAPVGGLQGALGGALAGGAAGTSIFGPGVGSLAGAGIGGLLGYLR